MDLILPQLFANEPLTLAKSSATVAYLAAAVLFVLSLAGLSKQTTARGGNILGIIGMLLAIAATMVYGWWLRHDGRGDCCGCHRGSSACCTSADDGDARTVAMLHSFVGLAAVLVGISSHLDPFQDVPASELLIHDTIFIGVFISAITFTGSIIAFLKLRGTIGGKPLTFPVGTQSISSWLRPASAWESGSAVNRIPTVGKQCWHCC